MKKLLVYPLIFGAMASLFCSCATQSVIAKAQGQPGPMDPPNTPPSQPKPAYYALVPLTFPFDLLAWPVEYLYLQNRNQSAPSGPPPQYQGDAQYLYSQPSQRPYDPRLQATPAPTTITTY